ncbi:MAG: orotidine-5'-phosphate decarboxylase [Patescibacteria group bacterium]|nr:orotidine-5'-phosphate decarboxylase [Patescibacteria group bacterium]
MDQKNAGLRLWEAQIAQGTGLCIGLDPHIDPDSGKLNRDFYTGYGENNSPGRYHEIEGRFFRVVQAAAVEGLFEQSINRLIPLMAGVTHYLFDVIDAAVECGIRVFKPQAACYEQFGPFGGFILKRVCQRLTRHAKRGEVFVIFDAKRGDIATSQAPYYAAYLSGPDDECAPALAGEFDFDAMTVTTWMGNDVLSPGLPFFTKGKGAVVVTRTSNPSGTTMQDALMMPNELLELSAKQMHFRTVPDLYADLTARLNRPPTVCEVMMYLTSRFSDYHNLNQQGISPLFSVIGATTKMDRAFRLLRPDGIALVPGFGAQKGQFDNIMTLYMPKGPMAGHLGILSSSRAHNYPWMTVYGGEGEPLRLKAEMERAITQFRADERSAYEASGLAYPFK